MAIFSGPEISNNGLVVYLDAANTRSYSGSGSTWNDLSTPSNVATLANGATISNNKLIFDGVDDVVRITAWPNTSSTTGFYTVEMLANWRSGVGGMLMGFTTYDIYTPSGMLGFNTGASDVYGISAARVTELGLVGSWKYYVFIFSTQVQNNEMWINGTKETIAQQFNTTNLTSTRTFSAQVNIGTWPNGSQYNPSMDLSYFRIYNRKLSQIEIQQNFEATRSRYGI